MLRYLRGKEPLEVFHDLIVWLVPGHTGKLIAALFVTVMLGAAGTFYFLFYYQKFARWMWGSA
jgi:hypothetical protein